MCGTAAVGRRETVVVCWWFLTPKGPQLIFERGHVRTSDLGQERLEKLGQGEVPPLEVPVRDRAMRARELALLRLVDS